MIKWDFISPSLRVVSGILKIEDITFGNGMPSKLLIKCKVKKETGMSGYSAISPQKSIPSKLFEELKPVIDTMVNSYYRGMLLRSENYEWIDDSANKDFEQWAEEKGISAKNIIKNIQVEDPLVCDICGLEHNSYTGISKCCKHLRKEK